MNRDKQYVAPQMSVVVMNEDVMTDVYSGLKADGTGDFDLGTGGGETTDPPLVKQTSVWGDED